jgi:hypothetical protein
VQQVAHHHKPHLTDPPPVMSQEWALSYLSRLQLDLLLYQSITKLLDFRRMSSGCHQG